MKQQRGGTFLGFILGLIVGLGVALAVAVYVTKVPITFLNKTSGHTAEQEATELQKNKEWDPNAPLYGKNPAKPATPAASAQAAAVVASPASAPQPGVSKPAPSADPLGELATARAGTPRSPASSPADTELFIYFVQAGAYRTAEDAEAQRAKLSLAGIDTKVSEREQSGRLVYRVRLGPYNTRQEADANKARLATLGIDTSLVRVQR